MADNSEHLDPKEATEAKLCAYLEGELSPAERIEIERHLAANPQHRALLADLAKTRDWMRSIPRESSPVDLGEVFQGQVERAMLLDDLANEPSGMSINRWPQYALVAAITILTLGLGVVLVAILKSPQQGGTFAIQKKTAPLSSPTTVPVDDVAKRSVKPFGPVASAAPSPAAAPEADYGQAPRLLMGGRLRANVSQADALKTKLASSGIRLANDQKTVCFVVSADAPATTVEQVRGFFERNQIAFDGSPADKPEAAQGFGGTGGGGIAYGNSRNVENSRNQLPGTPRAQAENNNLNGATLAQNQQQTRQQNQQFAQTQQNDPAPNTIGGGGAADNGNADKLTPITTSTGETVYIAHGVTPLQLESLNDSLVGNELKQTVNRVTLVDLPSSDANKASAHGAINAGAISNGETVTVTIPQLVGPGIEKVNVVKVADDGTISLPMLDPVPATGATVPELQQRIADKYREANLIDDATVTVVVANPPATNPTGMAVAKAMQPTTRAMKDEESASKATAAAAPATQPAKDASLVDVVVVITPSRFAAPAGVPIK